MMTRTRGLCRLEAKPVMKKAKRASTTGASNSKLQQKKHSNKSSAAPLLIDIKPPKVKDFSRFLQCCSDYRVLAYTHYGK